MEGVIFIVILFFIIIYFILKSSGKSYKNYRRRFYPYKNRNYNQYNKQNKVEKSKVERNLEYMADGKIRVKRIMNKEENQIYYTILKIFKSSYNINTQVSFKAFLDAEYGTKSWLSFRDFYCDFLLTYKIGDNYHKPAAVIEYHGGGHYGDSLESKSRVMENDIIKNEVLNKVGIKIFIIKEDDIKNERKYIDNKKLETFLQNIYSQIKSWNIKNKRTIKLTN